MHKTNSRLLGHTRSLTSTRLIPHCFYFLPSSGANLSEIELTQWRSSTVHERIVSPRHSRRRLEPRHIPGLGNPSPEKT